MDESLDLISHITYDGANRLIIVDEDEEIVLDFAQSNGHAEVGQFLE